jgi:hypothetical protein
MTEIRIVTSGTESTILIMLIIVRKGFKIWKGQKGIDVFSLISVLIALLASRNVYLVFKICRKVMSLNNSSVSDLYF